MTAGPRRDVSTCRLGPAARQVPVRTRSANRETSVRRRSGPRDYDPGVRLAKLAKVGVSVFTADMIPSLWADTAALDTLLRQEPSWRWGNPLTGDVLLRADDKDFPQFAGHPDILAAAVASIRDERTRAEIRARAEVRYRALAEQLDDARGLHLEALALAAERELEDQRTYLALIAELHD
jgi:hypothetical protein